MKMKVITFCAAALLMTAFKLNAQESGAQIRAGLNMANISVTDDGRVDDANALNSFQVGIVGDVHLGSILYVQPGLLFTGKGSKTERGDQNSLNYYKETFNPYYIEVPANLVFKLPLSSTSKLFFGAGPYLGIGVGGKSKVEGRTAGVAFSSERTIEFSNDDPTTTNQEEGVGFGIMKRFDYGLNGIAGIEGKSLALGVGYGYGLAKLPSGQNSGTNDNNKHRVLSLTLGLKL